MRVPRLLLALALVLAGCDESASFADAGRDDAGAPDCRANAGDFPVPVPGRCRAVVREGATRPAGEEGPESWILPGGERLIRVGRTVPLGGFPMRALRIPGTRFAVVTDGGLRDEVLATIDVDTMRIVDREDFTASSGGALFYGLAISADGRRLWASGGGTDRVLAFDVDPATGTLTRNAAETISVATTMASGYVSGLALREDGLLAVTLLRDGSVVLYDAATRAEVRRIAVEATAMPYDAVFSPDGTTLFVSLWQQASVAVIDVASGMVTSTIAVGKNPQALALSPDGSSLAVACSDSDLVAIIDVATRVVAERFYVVGESARRGSAPASVRFGSDGRLYVVDALENAIDVLERRGGGFFRVGRIPTLWHPTDVLPFEDGTILWTNGRGLGTGANVRPGTTDITDLMSGSVSVLAPADWDDAQLAAWEDAIADNNTRMARLTDVECEAGAAYDFPIPRPGTGASTRIRHVVVVVRENKTYDAYFGDLRDDAGLPHGNGDPTLTLIAPEEIEDVIPNTRALARAFALGDNYYSHAEQSIQGHVWTSMGRTTDFVERTWLTTWGRGYWVPPPQGTLPAGYPEEGSAFDYFARNAIAIGNYGEIVGARAAALDARYPGLVYSYLPDIDKANYFGSVVENCRLRTLSYLVMPNDHTEGLRPGAQTPRSMMADNDEGVARVVEVLSHSTYWPETAIFILWDDPQDGGDHVDNHRSALIVASPWARRGHVSSVHVSEASVWRTIQLILGLDAVPHSQEWQDAAPLYDFFTSTPDYTPYERIPRRWPRETNPDDRSAFAILSADYDWSEPDEQPGLSRMLWRHLRGTDPPWPVIERPFEAEHEE